LKFDVIDDEIIAYAILDRLVRTSYRIEFKGESLEKNGKIVSHLSSLNTPSLMGSISLPEYPTDN